MPFAPLRTTNPRNFDDAQARRAGDRPLAGSWMFAALLLLIAIEYLGLAAQYPFLRQFRVATVISYGLLVAVLLQFGVRHAFSSRQAQLATAFVVIAALSVMWAYVQTYAFNAIRPLANSLALLVITAAIVDRPSRFLRLALLFAVVAVNLVLTNLEQLSNAARRGGFVAGYFMGDGNDFAWGLVVILPFCLLLLFRRGALVIRGLGAAGLVACLLGIVGTQSRGGTLGLAAAALYGMMFVTRRRATAVVFVGLAVAAVIFAAPGGYVSRMKSIADYEADSSAQGRLQVWGTSVRMAIDHPLGVGAGNFSSAYGRRYLPAIEDNRIDWASQRWLSAHSIYFKVLGEYGALGFVMLLSLIGFTFADNNRSARALASADSAHLDKRWPAFLNMSLIGYSVGGIFLGGLPYPHLFVIVGLTLSLKAIVIPEAEDATRLPRISVDRPVTDIARPALHEESELQLTRLGYTVGRFSGDVTARSAKVDIPAART